MTSKQDRQSQLVDCLNAIDNITDRLELIKICIAAKNLLELKKVCIADMSELKPLSFKIEETFPVSLAVYAKSLENCSIDIVQEEATKYTVLIFNADQEIDNLLNPALSSHFGTPIGVSPVSNGNDTSPPTDFDR